MPPVIVSERPSAPTMIACGSRKVGATAIEIHVVAAELILDHLRLAPHNVVDLRQ